MLFEPLVRIWFLVIGRQAQSFFVCSETEQLKSYYNWQSESNKTYSPEKWFTYSPCLGRPHPPIWLSGSSRRVPCSPLHGDLSIRWGSYSSVFMRDCDSLFTTSSPPPSSSSLAAADLGFQMLINMTFGFKWELYPEPLFFSFPCLYVLISPSSSPPSSPFKRNLTLFASLPHEARLAPCWLWASPLWHPLVAHSHLGV